MGQPIAPAGAQLAVGMYMYCLAHPRQLLRYLHYKLGSPRALQFGAMVS